MTGDKTSPATKMHALRRTSPKGQPFIGTCTLCGREGLRASQAAEYCENIIGLTQEQALVDAIKDQKQ